jgi:hypothetical protein
MKIVSYKSIFDVSARAYTLRAKDLALLDIAPFGRNVVYVVLVK